MSTSYTHPLHLQIIGKDGTKRKYDNLDDSVLTQPPFAFKYSDFVLEFWVSIGNSLGVSNPVGFVSLEESQNEFLAFFVKFIASISRNVRIINDRKIHPPLFRITRHIMGFLFRV